MAEPPENLQRVKGAREPASRHTRQQPPFEGDSGLALLHGNDPTENLLLLSLRPVPQGAETKGAARGGEDEIPRPQGARLKGSNVQDVPTSEGGSGLEQLQSDRGGGRTKPLDVSRTQFLAALEEYEARQGKTSLEVAVAAGASVLIAAVAVFPMLYFLTLVQHPNLFGRLPACTAVAHLV